MKRFKEILYFLPVILFVMAICLCANSYNYVALDAKSVGDQITAREFNGLRAALTTGATDINSRVVNATAVITDHLNATEGTITTATATNITASKVITTNAVVTKSSVTSATVSTTLNIPHGTSLTKSSVGDIGWDSTDGVLTVHDGTADRVIGDDIFEAPFIISATGSISGGWASRTDPIFMAPKDQACTIVQISAALVGASDGALSYGVEERAFATPNTAGEDIFSASYYEVTGAAGVDIVESASFNSATIAAKSLLFFKTPANSVTNEVSHIVGSVFYRKNVE